MLIDLHPNTVFVSYETISDILKNVQTTAISKIYTLNLADREIAHSKYAKSGDIWRLGLRASNQTNSTSESIEWLTALCMITHTKVGLEHWFSKFRQCLSVELRYNNNAPIDLLVIVVKGFGTSHKVVRDSSLSIFDSLTKMFYGHTAYDNTGTEKLFRDFLILIDDDNVDFGPSKIDETFFWD